MARLAAQLEERRLIGTSILLLPARLRGVSVVVDGRASPLADLERVQTGRRARAVHVPEPADRRFAATDRATGWPAGRAPQPGRAVRDRLRHRRRESVNVLRVYETESAPASRRPARREPSADRARRADRVGPAYRQGDTGSERWPTHDGGARRSRSCTFAGGGFGTIQIERAIGSRSRAAAGVRAALPARPPARRSTPRATSACDSWPRFETVLDPLVATLDNLPEHFDAAYAPRDVLELLTDWLALERDELRSGEERRHIVRMSAGADAAGAEPGRGSSSRSSWPSRACRSGSRTAARSIVARGSRRRLGASSDVVRRLLRHAARAAAGGGRPPDRPGQAGARRLPAARPGRPSPRGGRRMRICRSCGRENPDDADFCVCGEYLRWEPTNHVRAVAAPAPAGRGGRSHGSGRG